MFASKQARSFFGALARWSAPACFAIACFGCKGSGQSIGVGSAIERLADLRPEASIPESAHLVLAGTRLPVTAKTTRAGSELRIELLAHSVVLETEQYSVSEQEFGLVNAAAERYAPALPLLRFPMRIGDSWSWEGRLEMADISRNASAKITSAKDRLNVEGFDDEAVRVLVELSIDSGGPTPAKRELAFWFVPQRGLLKREFGQASSRVPVPPKPDREKE